LSGPASARASLLDRTFLTFAGTETYLAFIQGFPLREFSAFEVVGDDAAWHRMEDALLRPIADAAATREFGLLADCLVWHASPDYIARLGAPGVGPVHERAVQRTREFVERWRARSEPRGPAQHCGVLPLEQTSLARRLCSVPNFLRRHGPEFRSCAP